MSDAETMRNLTILKKQAKSLNLDIKITQGYHETGYKITVFAIGKKGEKVNDRWHLEELDDIRGFLQGYAYAKGKVLHV